MISPDDPYTQSYLALSHERIGDVLVAQGDGPGALAAYRRGLEIRETLAARDPANPQWQRHLSVSHNKIGGVLVVQGDRPGALIAYRMGLHIAEALAARDPANTEWQRDLSVSHDRIGDVDFMAGDRSVNHGAQRRPGAGIVVGGFRVGKGNDLLRLWRLGLRAYLARPDREQQLGRVPGSGIDPGSRWKVSQFVGVGSISMGKPIGSQVDHPGIMEHEHG